MLSRRQLELINRKSLKYPLQVAEKDYMLALTLQLITNSPLGKKLVFKGGTAIHHCYLEQYRFSEDLDFSSGQQPISLKEVQGVLTSLDNFEIKKQYQSKTRLVKKGDLLLSNSMSYGRPYILAIDGAIHDGWLLIREHLKNIFKDYLYYILGSKIVKLQFDKSATGGVVKNLNIDLTLPRPHLFR